MIDNTISKILNIVGNDPIRVTFRSDGVGSIVFANHRNIYFEFNKSGFNMFKSEGNKRKDGNYEISVDWDNHSVGKLMKAIKTASRDVDIESDGVKPRRKTLVRPSREDLKNPNRKRDIPKEERDSDVHEDKDMVLSFSKHSRERMVFDLNRVLKQKTAGRLFGGDILDVATSLFDNIVRLGYSFTEIEEDFDVDMKITPNNKTWRVKANKNGHDFIGVLKAKAIKSALKMPIKHKVIFAFK